MNVHGIRSMAGATAVVMALSLAPVRPAGAVATATGAGIRITDPNGGPVAQAKITLTFNGEIKTAETDDDGVIGVLFGDSRTAAKPGTVVLTGDGTGRIMYPGGPDGGERFTVKDGVVTMTPAAPAADPKSPSTAFSKKKIGIAAGAGLAAVVILGASGSDGSPGGGGSSQPPAAQQPPSQTPATPTAPPGAAAPPSGPVRVQLTCIENSGGHHESVRGDQVGQIDVSGAATSLGVRMATINFSGPSPWVGVSGTWDPATGRFSATGRGRVAGVANVRCNFDGTYTAAGELEGDFVMGVGGGLPGGRSVTYKVVGRRN